MKKEATPFIKTLLFLLLFLSGTHIASAQLGRDAVQVVLDKQTTQQVEFADLDNDGDLDVLASRRGANGHLVWFEQLADGTQFGVPVSFGDTTWEDYPQAYYDFVLGDLDNDGDLDIVTQAQARASLPYWANNGLAEFIRPPSDPNETGSAYFDFEFVLGDFNNDNWEDILLYFPTSREIAINWNGGNSGTFEYQMLSDFDLPDHITMNEMLPLDYDQDGDLDLVFSYYGLATSERGLYLQVVEQQDCNACLVPQAEQLVVEGIRNQVLTQLHSSDFDQDGYPDLSFGYTVVFEATAGERTANLRFLRSNEGNGVFSTMGNLENYTFHEIADHNQDGLPDLYAVFDEDLNYSDVGDIYANHALYNQGGFNFSPTLIDDVFTSFFIRAVDLNQDNTLDLVSFNGGDAQSEIIWRSLEDEDWATPENLDVFLPSLNAIHLTDWDGDGDLDILTVDGNAFYECCPESIYLYTNLDGAGNYGQPQLILELPDDFLLAHFVDLNQDGQSDVVGTYVDNTISPSPVRAFYVLAQPDPTEMVIETLPALDYNYIQSFYDSDLDGDGDLDLINIQNNNNLGVLWNEINDGNGLVEEEDFLLAPAIGYQFLHKDINQDGKKDLVYFNYENLYWSLQQGQEDGDFSPWQTINPGPGFVLGDVLLADFDGDGDLDLQYQLRENGIVYHWVMVPFINNEFATPVPLLQDIPFSSSFDYTLSLNGDASADIVNESGFRVSIPGVGYPLNSYLPAPLNDKLPFKFYHFAQTGDVDGDGKPELVAGVNELLWYDLEFIPNQAVAGTLVWDTTGNCVFDTLLPRIASWPVRILSDDNEQLALTNVQGQYAGLLSENSTSHFIEPLPPSTYWELCPPDSTLITPLTDQVTTVNFAAQPTILCPLLEIDMVTTPLRQCFNSTVSISYYNAGTLPAEDASITLFFDERFTPVSGSMPWAVLTDTSVVFNFSSIEVNERGSLSIELAPDCETLTMGEEICLRAKVSPDFLCDDGQMFWNGAQLEASSFCENDSLAFRVVNTGVGAMTEAATYKVHIVNDDIVIFLEGSTQLEPGEADTIRIPLNEDVHRFSIDQVIGHPFPQDISLLSLSCLARGQENLLQALPNTDGNPFAVSICRPVIGPYDPNIKEGFPLGLGPENLIEPEWDLTYTIHFQNTGTDAARTVVLRDTLSPLLDLSTFRVGASSHVNEWIILPGRELVVTFLDINLPDSTSNEVASHGFFTFDIQPASTAAPLSLIENSAGIYFDFNPPIVTNTTQHKIRKPRIEMLERITLCAGEYFEETLIVVDTIIQLVEELPEVDIVTVYHITALSTPIVVIDVTLEEPGLWEGIPINQDTSITIFSTTALGCDSLTVFQLDVLNRTEQPAWVNKIGIGPNPTHGQVQIDWPAELGLKHAVLMTLDGRQLESWPLTTRSSLQINLKNQPAGVYLVELQSREGTGQFRLVKLGED